MKGNSFQSKHGLIASPFTVGNINFRIKGRVQVGVLLELVINLATTSTFLAI